MSRILLALLIVSLPAQNRLTSAEERGRQIYERGTSPSGGSIEALIAGDVRVAGSVLPCVNCHGHDGTGKPEAGVAPSNLTWDALTKPYGLTHPGGRTHPPYTERFLKRAITMGIDPAGNALNTAMPRFQLSLADASDLAAYIQRLGEALDPGLTGTTVRLGVILPSPSIKAGRTLSQALLDYFARVNGAGGIFGRRIDLTFVELPSDPSKKGDAVRDFLRNGQIFAVVGDFTGAESEIAGIMRDTGTPAIAAIAPFPQTGSPLNPSVFYLDGGVKQELDALIDFASDRFSGRDLDLAIVSSDMETSRQAATWSQERLVGAGHRRVVMSDGTQPVTADLVLWLRPGMPAPSVIATASRKPVLLIPGSLAGTPLTIPPIPKAQVFIALGAVTSREARPESRSNSRLTWDRAAASAAILTEAMKLAGHGLSRATLLAALEGFRSVPTNLPVPVSFGPNRRIGSDSIRIVMLDPQTREFTSVTGSSRAK